MNVIKAAEKSLELALSKKDKALASKAEDFKISESTTIPHIQDMINLMKSGDFSKGKLNRWLGWIQASIVSAINPIVTLEDMKQINKECDEDVPPPLSDLTDMYENYCKFHGLLRVSAEDQLSAAMEGPAGISHIGFLTFFLDQWKKSEEFYSPSKPE